MSAQKRKVVTVLSRDSGISGLPSPADELTDDDDDDDDGLSYAQGLKINCALPEAVSRAQALSCNSCGPTRSTLWWTEGSGPHLHKCLLQTRSWSKGRTGRFAWSFFLRYEN